MDLAKKLHRRSGTTSPQTIYNPSTNPCREEYRLLLIPREVTRNIKDDIRDGNIVTSGVSDTETLNELLRDSRVQSPEKC